MADEVVNESELRRTPREDPERGDLDNPNRVKRRETLDKILERQHVADFGWILSDERGRRFIWKFLGKCQVFDSCMTGNNTTFFNLGERNAGLRLMALINEHFPKAYLLMIEEAKRQQEANT